jgi:hypothetical protein
MKFIFMFLVLWSTGAWAATISIDDNLDDVLPPETEEVYQTAGRLLTQWANLHGYTAPDLIFTESDSEYTEEMMGGAPLTGVVIPRHAGNGLSFGIVVFVDRLHDGDGNIAVLPQLTTLVASAIKQESAEFSDEQRTDEVFLGVLDIRTMNEFVWDLPKLNEYKFLTSEQRSEFSEFQELLKVAARDFMQTGKRLGRTDCAKYLTSLDN